jgi:hypothetical protein
VALRTVLATWRKESNQNCRTIRGRWRATVTPQKGGRCVGTPVTHALGIYRDRRRLGVFLSSAPPSDQIGTLDAWDLAQWLLWVGY